MFASVLGFILILTCILFAFRLAKIAPYVDAEGKPLSGSISEKTVIAIDGVQQEMLTTSL